MTNVLRTYGSGADDDTVFGTAFSTEAFIHVRWKWLTLPAALSILSFAFLITAVTVSRRNSIPVWKSSNLAILFHGLEEKERLGPLEEIGETEATAKELKVALRDGNGGYRLV